MLQGECLDPERRPIAADTRDIAIYVRHLSIAGRQAGKEQVFLANEGGNARWQSLGDSKLVSEDSEMGGYGRVGATETHPMVAPISSLLDIAKLTLLSPRFISTN